MPGLRPSSPLPTCDADPSANMSPHLQDSDGSRPPQPARLIYTEAEVSHFFLSSSSYPVSQYLTGVFRNRVDSPSKSRPVDLDQVSTRLLQMSQKREPSRPPPESQPDSLYRLSDDAMRALGLVSPTGSRTPSTVSSDGTPDPDETRRRDMLQESIFCTELVRNGGRPWYPLERLDQVSRNPSQHGDLLRAWTSSPDDFQVFGRQFARWMDFGKWQQNRRNEFEGRVHEYTAWARRKLAKASITRPFEFNNDPTRQDSLTAWIEYLTFENNFYQVRYASVDRRPHWCDRHWQKLADSGVLRPHETREFLLNGTSVFERANEEEHARRAVKSAESALSAARRASGSSSETLAALEFNVELTRHSLGLVSKRLDHIARFVRATAGFRENQRRAERHRLLLQWIKEQLPLIEAEMALSVKAEGDPAAMLENQAGEQPRGLENQQDATT